MFPCFAEHYSIIYYLTIVKPVYNGQPWGITKVAFVWEHIYTVNAFVYFAVYAKTVGHMTGKYTIVHHMNPDCRLYTNIIYDTLC